MRNPSVKKLLHTDDGCRAVVLATDRNEAVEVGLRYVNNDLCYPLVITVGQILHTIFSGDFDTDKLAVMVDKACPGCRASNYISVMRRALHDAGYGHIPVLPVSFFTPFESHPGYQPSFRMFYEAIYGSLIADLLMQCLYRTRPYEAEPGSADALVARWKEHCKACLSGYNQKRFTADARRIVHDFDVLPLVDDRSKPRVGVVGEVFVKFNPAANNQVVELVESEGCEVVMNGMFDYFLYQSISAREAPEEPDGKAGSMSSMQMLVGLVDSLRAPLDEALRCSKRFEPSSGLFEQRARAERIISSENTIGQGWLLTADIMEHLERGVSDVICVQAFGCLPNHIVGRGTIRAIRRLYPDANICAVDYDPGASEVNQLNRIKLLVSVAFSRFRAEGR